MALSKQLIMVGMRFQPHYKDENLKINDFVYIKREPDNKVNGQAIAVYNTKSPYRKLGYIRDADLTKASGSEDRKIFQINRICTNYLVLEEKQSRQADYLTYPANNYINEWDNGLTVTGPIIATSISGSTIKAYDSNTTNWTSAVGATGPQGPPGKDAEITPDFVKKVATRVKESLELEELLKADNAAYDRNSHDDKLDAYTQMYGGRRAGKTAAFGQLYGKTYDGIWFDEVKDYCAKDMQAMEAIYGSNPCKEVPLNVAKFAKYSTAHIKNLPLAIPIPAYVTDQMYYKNRIAYFREEFCDSSDGKLTRADIDKMNYDSTSYKQQTEKKTMINTNSMRDSFFQERKDIVLDIQSGKLGVKTLDGLVTATDDGVSVNPITEMGLSVPAYAMRVAVKDLKAGDIIVTKNSAVFFKEASKAGYLTVDTNGVFQEVGSISNMFFGKNTVMAVKNMFGGSDGSGVNPMMLAMMMGNDSDSGDGFDFKKLMLLQMMSGQGGMGEMNPMLMMMLMK